MLRYIRKTTNNVTTQSLEEFCECCGEIVVPSVDIAEVAFKPANDNRTVYLRTPESDGTATLKTKENKRIEVASASIARGMLTQSGATTESLKYDLRSEKMCSSSVNYLDGQNIEYCYRMIDNASTASRKKSPRFLEYKKHYEDIFRDAPDDTLEGYKLGMSRHGKPIRLISESFTDELDVVQEKWYGAHKKQWFRDSNDAEKLLHLTASKTKADKQLQNYMFKESFDADTTASYYENKWSLQFDGVDDHVACTGYTDILDFDEDAFDDHGVTVNAWIYIQNSGSSGHPILAIGRNHNKYYGWLCRVSADFRLAMDHFGRDSRGTYGQTANHRHTAIQSNAVAPRRMYENKWIMATFVFKSSNRDNWSIWMNGKELTVIHSGATDANHTLTYNDNDKVYIGKLGKVNAAADNYFNGYINNIGVWKTALGQDSIQGLYNDGTPPYLLSGSGKYNQTGSNELIAYWEFSEGENVRVTDKVHSDGEGSLVNGTTWYEKSPLDDYKKDEEIDR